MEPGAGDSEERLPFDGGLVSEVVREAVVATRLETKAQIAAAPDTIELRAGHPIGTAGSNQLWSFDIDAEVAPQPETPATLSVPGIDPVTVRVLAVGDNSLVLGTHEDLGDAVSVGSLSMTVGFVHDALIRRLEEAVLDGDVDTDLVDALLMAELDEFDHDGQEALDASEEDDQTRAASRAIEAGLRFTWGPPGTGKTRVLGMAVAQAVERGDRVLVLAHANAAVDVAIASIADQLDGTDELDGGRVLRVGTPHLPAALDRPEVLPDRIVATRNPERVQRRDELIAERRELSDQARSATDGDAGRTISSRLEAIRSELIEIERALATAADGLLDDAVVVATTLAKLVVNDRLWDWPADVVVVDEASMAGLPFVLALAARGASTLSFFGDFRQLPPIAISESGAARHWFARDVFEMAGVVEAYETGRDDHRLSILRTQFRMGEQVCETINQFAYDGLLITDSAARKRAIRLAETWPAEGAEVVIVDTTSLGGGCVTGDDPSSFSRFSPSSAALSVALAETMAADDKVSIGLISPYKAQVSLLAAATRGMHHVTASTIHRFQGSERDVVVLDLVDGPNQTKPSRLTGADPGLALRLLNVAASRARGKLLVLADLGFIEQFHARRSTGRVLLDCAEAAGAETIDALDLLKAANTVRDPIVEWFPNWHAATDRLGRDLSAARHASLQIPDEVFSGVWLSEALADRTNASDVSLRAPADVARALEDSDLDVRLRVVAPMPMVSLDGSVLWIGGRTPENPVARVASTFLTRALQRVSNPGE